MPIRASLTSEAAFYDTTWDFDDQEYFVEVDTDVSDDDYYDDIEIFGVGSEKKVATLPEPPAMRKGLMGSRLVPNFIKGKDSRRRRHKKRNEKDGLLWHAQIVDDSYYDPKNCNPDGTLKNRRPMPIMRAADFFDSLQYIGSKWIVRTPLNG